MKKILISFGICLSLFTNAFSQSNNPFDYKGTQIKASAEVLLNDVKSGNITNYDNATIEANSDKLPSGSTVTVEMITNTMNIYNHGSWQLQTLLDTTSHLSLSEKSGIVEIASNLRALETMDFQAYITNKVSEITNSFAPPNEKEFLLTLCAAVYHLSTIDISSSYSNSRPYRICNATVNGETGPIPCPVAGALVGGIVGGIICGTPCAVGGAIIGFIVGFALK